MTPTGLGVLQVEPTDHCNLSCRMCAPHAERWESVHGIHKGYLPLSLYQHIIEGLAEEDCHFDHLILQWLGDPSLHPDLERMVGLAGKFLSKNLGYLRFDTNGILLDPRRMERLVEEKAAELPLLVVFTVDAQSPEVYQQVKGRDMLLKVRRHIRHLLALRRHSRQLHLQVQFVVQEQNQEELRAFHDYWREAWACHGRRGGHFELLYKRLSVSGGAKGQAQADLLYERAMEKAGIRPVEEEGFAVRTWERRPWQTD
ncbi:MAG TPA: radical SAM protein, partial [Myxococcota bacterium]|nr:radical SAM protein [Myxococcota bacterium]